MSKSLERVKAHANQLGLSIDILKMEVSTKTAQEAADAIDVSVNQIAKSIIFKGADSGSALLFLTAGGNRVDIEAAKGVAGEGLDRADADFIRAKTGFAIGGVSPLGHTSPCRSFFDTALLNFNTIWAAAGTPHHMFEIAPEKLAKVLQSEISQFTE